MRLTARRGLPAAWLVLLCVLLAGCGPIDSSYLGGAQLEDVRVLRLRVPSFDATQPEGVRLWRRSEDSGDYEPVSEILLAPLSTTDGLEYVPYTLLDPTGQPIGIPLWSRLEREPEGATLAFWMIRFADPGEFKASLFNAAGESDLSQESVLL